MAILENENQELEDKEKQNQILEELAINNDEESGSDMISGANLTQNYGINDWELSFLFCN